jgi:Flp pilus assembly protein CpaB
MLNKLLHNSRNLLIIGALLAAAAFALTFMVLNKAQGSPVAIAGGNNPTPVVVAPTPTPVPAPMLVAQSDIPAFTAFTDTKSVRQFFKEQPVKGYVNPNYVQGYTGFADMLTQGPRHLMFKLTRGDTLLNSELISNTVAGTIDYAGLLNTGEVAESVSVQPVAADNGNIQPSDHVDLLLTLKLDLTKAQAAQRAFFTNNGTTLGPGTLSYTWVGSMLESQTTLQNLRVLSVSGTNYTLAVTHQDALMLKWVKDYNGIIDLVVRSSDDSGKKPKLTTTKPVLPDALKNGSLMHGNPFNIP